MNVGAASKSRRALLMAMLLVPGLMQPIAAMDDYARLRSIKAISRMASMTTAPIL